MPNTIEIYKPGKVLVGADIDTLMHLSTLSSLSFKFFLGKNPSYPDFLSSNRRLPISSLIMVFLVRFLFRHLEEFPRAELTPTASPYDVREYIHQHLHDVQCPYTKELGSKQFAALFGMTRIWASSQVSSEEHGELMGPSETMMRASTVLMHCMRLKGMSALQEWCAVVREEGWLRGQPDVLNAAWVASDNRAWYKRTCDKINNTKSKRRIVIRSQD